MAFGFRSISKSRFDRLTWTLAHGLILSTLSSRIKSVLQGSVGVVKRCEMDPMPCSHCCNLVDSLRSDESSSLREGLEPVFQGKSHAFKETAMNHIGERMPIQNSMKIRSEPHSAGDLSETSEEDFGVKHLCRWRQVLRVARIANNGVWRDPAAQKRRGRQTCRADHDVGLCGELLEIRRDLDLRTIVL